MTTPRKAWFRVADSILYETWDDSTLATMVRLMAHLNTRWAREGRTREESCQTILGPMDLAKITGKKRVDSARLVLNKLATSLSLVVRLSGDNTEIIWRKYAEFQQYPPEKRPQIALSASASASAPASATEREEPTPSAPPASPATTVSKANGKSRRTLVPKPEAFPPESHARLKAWGEKHGFGKSVLNAGLEAFREWVPVKPPYSRPIETWEGAFKKITRDCVADGKVPGDAKPKGLAYAEWTGHGDEVAR